MGRPTAATAGAAVVILMADDDPDDQMLAGEALAECRLVNTIRFVGDGEELMDYLKRQGDYSVPAAAPRPGLILLDLNMPRKNGREALQEIKADPDLRSIPVVILTTSSSEEDIAQAYDAGANSYIAKPVTFEGLVEVMKRIRMYWLEIVEMPAVTYIYSRKEAEL
ncbi:MAG: response regulator [Fibrella sp.]|nr:response regulator [Armatimonadota bacterium]